MPLFKRKIKTADYQTDKTYKWIQTLIETAETPNKLLDAYFTDKVQKEINLMKVELRREIESKYLLKKDNLLNHKKYDKR